MATIDVVNKENSKVGTLELNDAIFDTKVNVPLVHQVIKAQLAGRRAGTAHTKTRSFVRGGGKKPYKQKGTGNARRGSSRSPVMVGGARVHGPQTRSYEQGTPKEMMRGALRSALSDRFQAKRLIVIDELKFDQPKTKELNQIMSKTFNTLTHKNKALVVDADNSGLELSGRNIPLLKVLRPEGLNVYDVVKHEWLFITKAAAEKITHRLEPKSSGKASS